MNPKAVLLIVASAIVAQVQALDFYITSPWSAITWTTGQTVTITWDIIPGGTPATSVSIDIMDGSSWNAAVVQHVVAGLPTTAQSYTWTVPSTVPTSTSSFVRLSGVGVGLPTYRYSHVFTIQGAAPPVVSTDVVTAVVATTVAPPASSTTRTRSTITITSTSTRSSSSSSSSSSTSTSTRSTSSILRSNSNSSPPRSTSLALPVLGAIATIIMGLYLA